MPTDHPDTGILPPEALEGIRERLKKSHRRPKDGATLDDLLESAGYAFFKDIPALLASHDALSELVRGLTGVMKKLSNPDALASWTKAGIAHTASQALVKIPPQFR